MAFAVESVRQALYAQLSQVLVAQGESLGKGCGLRIVLEVRPGMKVAPPRCTVFFGALEKEEPWPKN